MLLINKENFKLQSDRRVVKAADAATVRSAAEIVSGVLCVGLLILSTILLIASKNNPFLYFRF